MKSFFRKLGNQTGVSVLDGDAPLTVDNLPDFRIEIHQFPDSRTAEAFIQGFSYMGNSNSVVYDWETGTTASNSTVIIGKLDEEAPNGTTLDTCLVFVEHTFGNHDSQAIALHLEEISRERDEARLKDESDSLDILNAYVTAGGTDLTNSVASGFVKGNGWVRVKNSYGDLFTVTFKDKNGPYNVDIEFEYYVQETQGYKSLFVSKIREHGFETDEYNILVKVDNIATLDELVKTSDKISEALKDAKKACTEAQHTAFLATIKMTSKRKKMLECAYSLNGFNIFNKRGNTRARVGLYDIGQTEINRLTSAGWVVRYSNQLKVTQAGIEAANIKETDNETA